MATLKCEVIRREGEGAFPCVVRSPEGRVLRLHGDAAPRHARWLGLCDGVAVWSEPADNPGPGLGVYVEIHVAELVDEVGVALGPDRDSSGLFDPPSEASLTGERTGVSTEEAGAEQQRTAVLAWIAASLGEPNRLPEVGAPCAALRTRIADEPPDLLPSLGFGAVVRDARVLRAPPAPPPAPPGPGASFTDDTVTQVDLLPPRPEDPRTGVTGATTTGHTGNTRFGWLPSERIVRVALLVSAVLLGLSAYAWWRFA